MRDILVTGGNGQLGTELQRHRWPDGWRVVAIDLDELDLGDTAAIAAKVAERSWAAVISAGAYTAVDKAEEDAVTAWRINAVAPAALAVACARADIPIVHVSTDYVFSGDKAGPWHVDDPVCPVSVYGASKLGGELAVATSAKRYVIVRTAWLVSAHGNNFIKTMLRLGESRDNVSVVADQHGSPTSAADLAAALADIAVRLVEDPMARTGTYHFSNAGPTTWYGFACEIFEQARSRGQRPPSVAAIGTSDYPTPARRPANSLLSTDAIRRDYGIVARPWRDALSDILDELIGKSK